jgi:hypothetical protein
VQTECYHPATVHFPAEQVIKQYLIIPTWYIPQKPRCRSGTAMGLAAHYATAFRERSNLAEQSL